MDAFLRLKSKPNVIDAATDFTYQWALQSGLDARRAARLALAISELVTDVVLFAFGHREGEMEISYLRHTSNVEIVVHELGEPFNPDRHPYSAARAVAEMDFEGAGLELVRRFTDEFIYRNRGKQGKEFRLMMRLEVPHITDLVPKEELREPAAGEKKTTRYEVQVIRPEDAESIAKLIYRTYGHTYHNESLYFPRKLELEIQQQEKFGVIAYSSEGDPAGYFAILKSTDSNIGEVGEAVVAVPHRRQGVMTMMLEKLVDAARERGLLGLYGEANAAHLISQRTNAKFGFHSAAVLLAVSPAMSMEGFAKEISEQPVSCVFEFLPLMEPTPKVIYPPARYRAVLQQIYQSLDIPVAEGKAPDVDSLPEESEITVSINYEDSHALLVVERYGLDFQAEVLRAMRELEPHELNTLQMDLPLEDPFTAQLGENLSALGFIFSGLMPFFHQERDYLRLQRIPAGFDFDWVRTYSDLGRELKNITLKEYYEVQTGKQTSRN